MFARTSDINEVNPYCSGQNRTSGNPSHELARIFHVFPKACEPPYVRNAVGKLENTSRTVPSKNHVVKTYLSKASKISSRLTAKRNTKPSCRENDGKTRTPGGSRGLLGFPVEQSRHWKIEKTTAKAQNTTVKNTICCSKWSKGSAALSQGMMSPPPSAHVPSVGCFSLPTSSSYQPFPVRAEFV